MFENTCILDLETTGLSPVKDEIIEVAVKLYSKDISYTTIVKPTKVGKAKPGYHGAYILPVITEITGITNLDIYKHGIPQEAMIHNVYNFLIENNIRYIISHNGERFDFIFIKLLFNKYNLDYRKFIFIDSLCLIKNILNSMNVNLNSYSQSNLCKYLNITQENAHRAMGDVIDLENMVNLILTNYSVYHNKYINYNTDYIYNLSKENNDNFSDIIMNYINKFIEFLNANEKYLTLENINSYKRSLVYQWIESNNISIDHKTFNNNLQFIK